MDKIDSFIQIINKRLRLLPGRMSENEQEDLNLQPEEDPIVKCAALWHQSSDDDIEAVEPRPASGMSESGQKLNSSSEPQEQEHNSADHIKYSSIGQHGDKGSADKVRLAMNHQFKRNLTPLTATN